METLYDKLGDLLSEALSAGRVPPVKKPGPEIPRAEHAEDGQSSGKESFSSAGGSSDSSRVQADSPHTESGSRTTERRSRRRKEKAKAASAVFRPVSPQLERAYRLLGIPPDADAEAVKKAYKSRIRYFHPDKYQGNAVLQKVATDKTRQVVEAYELIQRERF